MDNAFQYIIQNNGIASEADYPYRGVPETCQNTMTTSAQINDFKDVPPNDEQQLLQAVAMQPVSVGIAIGDEFKAYTGGVYDGSCGQSINHAVTLVGYGTSTEYGTKYWLVKNSWGEDWGERGYMRLVREGGDPQGHCGIATHASYPTL